MRMINRLEVPTSGRILADRRDISRVDLVRLRRTIGRVAAAAEPRKDHQQWTRKVSHAFRAPSMDNLH